MVDELIRAVGGGVVLDAGCGAGRMSRYLADRGCRVEGVDLSAGMVEQARVVHPDLTFAVAALEALPHPDDAFDGVLLWYSIIHTPPERLPGILSEVARVVRPGGHLLVGFQCGTGVQDLAAAYSTFGHRVVLERYRYTADQVSAGISQVGGEERARLVRAAEGPETDQQAVILAQLPSSD